ncbi:3'(2'),5'-bisphosphate nucleotidase [Poriferisphaera sp. WC338]|uniref:3'(2'),5'-bisphosphate nucleotidase n=1 Tax=Poriferisphaera sp. WC338 TaxID=3425129 RepID=UPI003D815761
MSDLSEQGHEFEVAVSAVQAAGVICREVQRRLVDADSMEKKDKSPVTVADYASQAIVCGLLAESFEGVAVIGEEDSADLQKVENTGLRDTVVELVNGLLDEPMSAEEVLRWIDVGGADPVGRNMYWTLDPIDGTKGFLRREQYAIALAKIEQGELTMGVLGCPNMQLAPRKAGGIDATGVLITAVKGQGACIAPMAGNVHQVTEIRVSDVDDLAKAKFCESVESGHSNQSQSAEIAAKLGITTEPFRIDSQCKYAAIARGDAEIYLRLPTRKDYQEKIWDHGAGAMAVMEAGGTVTDVYGKPLDFSKGKTLSANKGVIATNGKFHDQVVMAVGEVLGV